MTSRDARRKELPRLINEEKEILRKLTDELALRLHKTLMFESWSSSGP